MRISSSSRAYDGGATGRPLELLIVSHDARTVQQCDSSSSNRVQHIVDSFLLRHAGSLREWALILPVDRQATTYLPRHSWRSHHQPGGVICAQYSQYLPTARPGT